MFKKKFKPGQELKIEFECQGAVRVDSAYIDIVAKDIMAVTVSLHTKNADISCYMSGIDGTVGIGFEANEETIYVDETKDRDLDTIIHFPDLKGWRLWSASTGRYDCCVCFIKE